MDESYTSLPTSHLLGSVPAAITEDKKTATSEEANLQIFPPNNGGDRGWGYQAPGTTSGYFLNPRFQYQEGIELNNVIRLGVNKFIERPSPNVNFSIQMVRKKASFRGKIGCLGDHTMRTTVAIMNLGFFVNPRFQYQEGFEYNDHIRSGVTKVIERLAPDVTFAIEATRELAQFRGKIGRFGDLTTQTAVGIMNPGGDEQPAASWKGLFSISSYSPYFNVDTDIVVDRIINSMYPLRGDFFRKIDANPDLYGPLWISTTLVFMLAALGNCATYLMNKKSDKTTAWSFDVSYINWAACSVYGYAILLPVAFYFLLNYFGSNVSLIRLWCMWGYSLFIFTLSSFLLVVPAEIFRWIVIILTGAMSACFVTQNISSYIAGSDLTLVIVCSLLLQIGLAIFFKVCFFA